MRQIKNYKLFEATSKFKIESQIKYVELEPDVNDILLELTDSGVISHTSRYIDDNIFEFKIDIGVDETRIKTKEQKQICEDTLFRLEYFLSQHDLQLGNIELNQEIIYSGNLGEVEEFNQHCLYNMSELGNLKETAGSLSFFICFFKDYKK